MKPIFAGRLFFVLAFVACLCATASAQGPKLTSYVDPRIGTGGHGHVFMGANVPFGLVQLGPTQPIAGWDWCSGYHADGQQIIGFSHTHLAGTGVGDLGDIAFLPIAQAEQTAVEFTHDQETARPGYYGVHLEQPHCLVELTATERVGIHRYTFDSPNDTLLLALDLAQGINEGIDDARLTDWLLTQESPTRLTGLRRQSGWAQDRRIYFVADFSRAVSIVRRDPHTRAVLAFSNAHEPIVVKVALSAVDIDHAKQSMQAEAPDFAFDHLVAKADKSWEQALRRMTIKSTDESVLRNFYTSLFHLMVAPSVFSDVDGCYRGADGQVHRADHTTYTTFSLWDTYRAAHPLLTLICPERQADFARTFINIYRQQGKLPIWHLMGNETNCMAGSPCVPVLGDLVEKGFCQGFEQEAYEAMRQSMMLDERSLGLLKQYGYIPYDLESEDGTVSKALEYCLADHAVSLVAERLGAADKDYFHERSQSYRKYFDPQTRFLRAVSSQGAGSFREPFNPFYAGYDHNDYVEGNAWQYTWMVPHDPHGLISLFGGDRPFIAKLDSLFITPTPEGTEVADDVTGLVGQYAQGNEPSHHALYLYNYAGAPAKAAPWLRQMLTEQYRDQPDGLSGNEDVGQMSAWYLLSAVGLYQVEPTGGRYVIGSPIVDEATLQVGHGRTFTVKTVNNSPRNIYVQRATLNGNPYRRSFVDYSDISQGGTLTLFMGDKPSRWGTAPKDRP